MHEPEVAISTIERENQIGNDTWAARADRINLGSLVWNSSVAFGAVKKNRAGPVPFGTGELLRGSGLPCKIGSREASWSIKCARPFLGKLFSDAHPESVYDMGSTR